LFSKISRFQQGVPSWLSQFKDTCLVLDRYLAESLSHLQLSRQDHVLPGCQDELWDNILKKKNYIPIHSLLSSLNFFTVYLNTEYCGIVTNLVYRQPKPFSIYEHPVIGAEGMWWVWLWYQ